MAPRQFAGQNTGTKAVNAC